MSEAKKQSSTNWYVWMLIILILVIIAGMAINICIMNRQFKKNEAAISKSKQINNPLKLLQADSTKTIKLKEEDLQKFNEHIDYLSDKVEVEVKRTQENSQYDIDRINTMLAIGIGILAIIGGLLPIFVNYFSKENLEKRIEEIEKSASAIQSTSDAAKVQSIKAKDEAEKANNSLQGIEGKIDNLGKDLEPLKKEVGNVKEATKKIPYIALLVLQNAVAKLTSSDALKLFISSHRYDVLRDYLQNLISAIGSFDDYDFGHEHFDISYFKNVMTELKLALRLGPIRRIPDSRSFQDKIDEAVLQLDKFEKMETKDFKTQLKVVSKAITELKELVEKKG